MDHSPRHSHHHYLRDSTHSPRSEPTTSHRVPSSHNANSYNDHKGARGHQRSSYGTLSLLWGTHASSKPVLPKLRSRKEVPSTHVEGIARPFVLDAKKKSQLTQRLPTSPEFIVTEPHLLSGLETSSSYIPRLMMSSSTEGLVEVNAACSTGNACRYHCDKQSASTRTCPL